MQQFFLSRKYLTSVLVALGMHYLVLFRVSAPKLSQNVALVYSGPIQPIRVPLKFKTLPHQKLHSNKGQRVFIPSEPASTSPNFAEHKRYKDLFPSDLERRAASDVEASSVDSSTKQTEFNHKVATGQIFGITGPRLEPREDRRNDELASKVLVPHFWRDLSEDGHAIAYIMQTGDGLFWIRSLAGVPLLRAILYENIMRDDFYRLLRDHMHQSKLSEFKIVLRFLRESDSYRGVNSEIAAFKDGLVITKKLPPLMRVFPGVALSDSHAQRAKARDKAQLHRLMELPAFSTHIDHQVIRKTLF